MLKKKFIIIVLLFLPSCGYEAMYSKKNSANYEFAVSDLSFVGDKIVNLKIKEKLNNYAQDKKEKDFILRISSASEKIILSKKDLVRTLLKKLLILSIISFSSYL